MKSVFAATMIAAAALMLSTSAMADDRVYVTINGKELVTDTPAQIMYERTMLPVRAIFEGVGAEVQWDAETKTVTGTLGERTVEMSVNSNIVTIDGVDVTMDVMPTVVNDRVLVPARYVAESFDLTVNWDAANKEVEILDSKHTTEVTTQKHTVTEAATEGTTQQVKVIKLEKTTETTTAAEVTEAKQDRSLITGVNKNLYEAIGAGIDDIRSSYVMGKTTINAKKLDAYMSECQKLCTSEADNEFLSTAFKCINKLDQFYLTSNNFVVWRKNNSSTELCTEYINKVYGYLDEFMSATTLDKANGAYSKLVSCYNEFSSAIAKETNAIQ